VRLATREKLTGDYVIDLTRTGGALDDLPVRMEATAVLEGEAASRSAYELVSRPTGMCGVSATLEIAKRDG